MIRLGRFATGLWHLATKVLPVIVGIVALVLIIAWLSGTFETKIEPQRQEGGARTIGNQPTDMVHEVTKAYIDEAIGTLKAASRTVISAKVLATIEAINVRAGDQVNKDDVLVQLDSKELDAKLRQAEQVHAAAIATRSEAETNFERIEGLLAQQAASKAQFDAATRSLDVARANVLGTEQAINEAKVMLSYATITAPKSGRIVDRLAEPGDTARPGEPLLVLYDATSLRLEAPVLEQLAVKLRVGQQLDVYIDALHREVVSTIDEIVPQADAPSRSFLVKASVPRSEDLYEGMFGRLRIPAGQRRHLCLATDAIQTVGQLEFVEVVLRDGHVERRYIKTGRLGMPGRIEVLSGLKAGERVILHKTANPQKASSNGGGNDSTDAAANDA